MGVIRHKVQSCCGHNSYVFETNKPVKKSHIDKFKAAGYLCPQNFIISGVFYVAIKNLIATTAYGSTRIQVKCSGPNCRELMDKFAGLLNTIVNS